MLTLPLPTLVTILGTSLSLWWLSGAHPVWGLIGLLLDAVDGRVARALNKETKFGAELDFLSDVGIGVLCLMSAKFYLGLPVAGFLCIALLSFAAACRTLGYRASGRTLVMLPALGYEFALEVVG